MEEAASGLGGLKKMHPDLFSIFNHCKESILKGQECPEEDSPSPVEGYEVKDAAGLLLGVQVETAPWKPQVWRPRGGPFSEATAGPHAQAQCRCRRVWNRVSIRLDGNENIPSAPRGGVLTPPQ